MCGGFFLKGGDRARDLCIFLGLYVCLHTCILCLFVCVDNMSDSFIVQCGAAVPMAVL